MMHLHKTASEAKTAAEKFVVRLPSGMRQEIADVARRSRRSMNSEIIARLERSLAESDSIKTITEHPLAPTPSLHLITDSSEAEQRLLKAFRKLSPSKREAMLQLVD